MKTMFENMISLIIMMIFVFVFVGIISVETQIINARNIHSRVIELYQNSNHDLNEPFFNDSLSNGHISINDLNERESEIIYEFDVDIPFLNIIDKQRIVGFSR